MRINSNAMANVFKAYTRQLRSEYAKADRDGQLKNSPARGFEQVSLSKEAIALAAGKDAKEAAKDTEETEEKDEKSRGNEEASKAETENGVSSDNVSSTGGSGKSNK